MNSKPTAWQQLRFQAGALRLVGLRSAGWWMLYQWRLRSGWLEARTPAGRWEQVRLGDLLLGGEPSRPEALREAREFPFFFDDAGGHIRPRENRDRRVADMRRELEECLAGRFLLWNDRYHDFGFPPAWNRNALSPCDEQPSSLRHWSEIRDTGADLKGIWELSRFSIAFRLAREYAYTGEEKACEAFWVMFESWLDANPFNSGPNWMSAQEVALRAIAWVFALRVFARSPQTTDSRLEQMLAALSLSARRIEVTLDYARAQNNNHLVSEAAGLWTIGILFPSLRRAKRWAHRGRDLLLEAANREIFEDGGYIQHSFNYQRLMLDLYLWSVRLGEITGRAFPYHLYERLKTSVAYLRQWVDAESGRTPNLGHNDGSLLLPLTGCEYEDYRPTVQALCELAGLPLPYAPGPWDEERQWLMGPHSAQRGFPRVGAAGGRAGSLENSGTYLLKGRESWGMVRCSHFRSRPAHADQLHFDLWWRGTNLACDAGTYLYSGPPPWYNSYAHGAVHNAVVIDGRDQMSRLGRFLWTEVAQGQVERFSSDEACEIWQGSHSGYRPLGVRHRRAIARAGDLAWVIVDDLLGSGPHAVRLHWLLSDLTDLRLECGSDPADSLVRVQALAKGGPVLLQVQCSAQAAWDVARAGQLLCGTPDETEPLPTETRGWQSTRYASLTPAVSVVGTAHAALPVRWISVWSLNEGGVEIIEPGGRWHVGRPGGWSVELAPLKEPGAIRSVVPL
ncbi:MAG: alginate lyase family protein [Anaerolineales bacterium]|jgi:asparagine synthase (glutamine-hydrolysing)